MTFNEAFAYLQSFANFERDNSDIREYRLDRMAILLESFDAPHRAFRVIHVAGSKGKGSTANLLATVLANAGHKTGLFTSPHVESYAERIRLLGGEPLTDGDYVRGIEAIKATIEAFAPGDLPTGEGPTTFELLTLLAFNLFREAGCDWVVVETGLGGRLDTTNLVEPAACVITAIELEHTDLLGDTLEKIAAEKGGIIKPGVPVFTGRIADGPLKVIDDIAKKKGAPHFPIAEFAASVESVVMDEASLLTVVEAGGYRFTAPLPFHGDAQARNAALAYHVCRRLALEGIVGITTGEIKKGFAQARLPGRGELFPGANPVMLDGAHTADSVTAIREVFEGMFPKKRRTLLFGSVEGKNASAMATALAPHFDRVIITRPGTFKKSNPTAVANLFRAAGADAELIEPASDAWAHWKRTAVPGEALLVTGSFYLLGEIRPLVRTQT